MTHEQYITLETAKLAKQAGFDWRTYPHYQDIYKDELLKAGLSGNWNQYKDCCSAPTQSVLQKWLREEKGYHIYISHTYTAIDCQIKSIWEVLYEKMSFLKPNSILILEDDFGRSLAFDTYEAALEAGLQKCLLEIIDN